MPPTYDLQNAEVVDIQQTPIFSEAGDKLWDHYSMGVQAMFFAKWPTYSKPDEPEADEPIIR